MSPSDGFVASVCEWFLTPVKVLDMHLLVDQHVFVYFAAKRERYCQAPSSRIFGISRYNNIVWARHAQLRGRVTDSLILAAEGGCSHRHKIAEMQSVVVSQVVLVRSHFVVGEDLIDFRHADCVLQVPFARCPEDVLVAHDFRDTRCGPLPCLPPARTTAHSSSIHPCQAFRWNRRPVWASGRCCETLLRRRQAQPTETWCLQDQIVHA